MKALKRFAGLALVVFVSGCAGGWGDFKPSAGTGKQTWLAGAVSGSSVSSRIASADRNRIEVAAIRAVQDPASNKSVSWAGRSGTKGTVVAGPPLLVDLNGGPEMRTPFDIALNVPLDPASGDYATTKRSNVRLGPSTDHKIVTTLDPGTPLKSLGHAKQVNWYLVGQGDRAIGFIYGPLIKKTSAGDPVLAGGGTSLIRMCRELTYRVQLPDGKSDAWVNGACRVGNGPWQVVGGSSIPTS